MYPLTLPLMLQKCNINKNHISLYRAWIHFTPTIICCFLHFIWSTFTVSNKTQACIMCLLTQELKTYPAGIRHPCETKFDNHLQDLEHSNYTLNIPLIPTTPEEMEDMFRLCSHVRFKIPHQVRPTFQNKHSMDYTLCVPTVDHNYRNVFKSSYILCSNTFSRLDSSRTGRCPGASQHILPRRLVHFSLGVFFFKHMVEPMWSVICVFSISVYGACWREITICLTGAPASHHCAFTSDMGQTRSGNVWRTPNTVTQQSPFK